MKTLCIVPCGKRKIWDKDPKAGPTEAKNVCTGPFAMSCRRYAERFYPLAWCIISAKHGFLFPEDVVPGPYEATFSKPKTNPITIGELKVQAAKKGFEKYQNIIVIAGKEYVRRVQQVFPEKEISTPLIHCSSQGQMMSKLRNAREKGKPV
jgi:hypothetical protein